MSQLSYTGDLQLGINGEGEWDITYENGQPYMTDTFDTCITLAIFGEPDFWQNQLTDDPSEKYISEFPSVVSNALVNNQTINDGVSALNKALQFLIKEGIAESINVTGSMTSVYQIDWQIGITKDGTNRKYSINWEKGELTGFNKEI